MEYVGLRWYKCDFHLHTMSSKCYKERETDTPAMWVDEVKNKGLKCIAITDHNDYSGIDEIKSLCEKEGIVAFPGVELSCDSSKIHILIIFDVNCNASRVQEFLNKVEIFSDSLGDSGVTCKGDITEVCENAQKMGGLVIAAHIDDFSGICQMSHDNLLKILDRKYINAVQVVNSDIWENFEKSDIKNIANLLSEKYGKEISEDKAKSWHKAYEMARKAGIPMLSFSDNPLSLDSSSHGLWGIGSHYSWLKMDNYPKLESVRQALLSFDMRLRPDFKCIDEPDNNPDLFIEAIEIQGTLLNEKNIVLRFNPQMNAIIGGRGSGKSSIIRTIAGGLRSFDAENLGMINTEQHNFYKQNGKIKGSTEKKGIFKSTSTINIFLKRVEDAFKIEISEIKSMEEQVRKLYRLVNNEWVEEPDKNYLNFFKAQIFTQKQIYELAMDSNSLLNIIDEDIDGLNQDISNKDAALNNVISKLLEINDLKISIQEEKKIETELKDIDDQISKFKKSGISDALKEKQLCETQSKQLEDYVASKNDQMKKIFNLIEEVQQANIVYQPIDNVEIDSLMEKDLLSYNQKIESIKQMCDLLNKETESLEKKIELTDWKNSLIKANESYTELCSKLEEQGVNFSRLDDLLEKRKIKLKEVDRINSDKIKLGVSEKECTILYKKYEKVIKNISDKRTEFIYGVIGNDTNVKFNVLRNRNRSSFVNIMKTILQKDIQSVDEDIQELADVFFDKNGVIKFRQIMKDIRDGIDVKSYSAKTRIAISDMTPELFARLISFLPEDDLTVSYKPENSKKFIPLSNASAGQKTTAILTFLLAYGKSPLLLDQPEDDLDNKLVFDLIVTRLKKTKSNRQIIVVTHNANIPVNGDAEYIVSMDSESDIISTKYEGTMDDQNIRKEICDVMEGTKDAFEMRAKKYHFNITE